MRVTDRVVFSLAASSAQVGPCELCSVGPETLRTVVSVQHTRGATVVLAACDRCATAMRRLTAVAGHTISSVPSAVTVVADDPRPSLTDPSTVDVQGSAQTIHEFGEAIGGEDGRTYTVRVVGQARGDGTWIGWLTFVPVDGDAIRHTGRETTQSSRQHLAYWATGLERSYLEGALKRAAPTDTGRQGPVRG